MFALPVVISNYKQNIAGQTPLPGVFMVTDINI